MSRCHLAFCVTAAVLLASVACIDPCGNVLREEKRAPGGSMRVVVFERDCGATTGFSSHVSILEGNGALPNRAGNVFVADGNHGAVKLTVVVNWQAADHLVISFTRGARVFRQEKQFGNIRISYELISSE